MACCGRNRQLLSAVPGASSGGTASYASKPGEAAEKKYYTVAYFEYTGKTKLTVIGPRTGKRYVFDKPGAVVMVDLKDRLSLTAVAGLRQKKM